MAAGKWEELMQLAEQTLKEDPPKFFEGVQHINSCMEIYSKDSLGAEGVRIIKEPQEFVKEHMDSFTPDQKSTLKRLYELRGDIITGLGANKRAALDYSCAEVLSSAGEKEGVASKKSKAEEASKSTAKPTKVPVTVVTGFLGSGKTTLLNRILKENHGKKIGIIENEFGEVGIDDSLLELSPAITEENIVEMNNGCICCTVRGDLIAGLKKMIKSANKSGKQFDAILIETTGLADPAPVAQTFFADEFVQQHLTLDGILTVCDAKHLVTHLDEEKPEGVENEAVEQVAFADRVLLNKCDMVEEADLDEVEKRIRSINGPVQIRRTKFSQVDMDFILGIQAFCLDKILEMDDGFLDDAQEHQHDDRVSSVGLNIPGECDQGKLNGWIGDILKDKGADIFRTKGVLAVRGTKEKYVFQAVHMAFTGASQKPWAEGEQRVCKMTFIGKNLNRKELEEGFKACMVK